MPNWYYDKSDLKQTPSNLDNLDYETEQRYRREGARFIINVGTTMGLRYDTMATGVVYFHRFYMFHSFRTFPRYVTACCCLFLAGKVEETPKKCKDIIKTARNLLTDQYFAQFGEDPKEEVMTLERILLQTIKFDLQVDHPYSYLLKYAKALKGDKTKVQKLVQMAWTFVNDSLCTTLCLQWEPEIIAIALMYLASKLSKFEVVEWAGRSSKHNRWWDMFVEDMTVELLEDICHQVLDLYSTPISNTPRDSPPSSPPAASSSVRSRPPTPLPTVKPSSPVKVEAVAAPVTAAAAAAPPPPVTPVVAAIPTAAVVAAAPLPPAPAAARAPVATPAVIVGHPIPCLEEGVVKPPLPPPPSVKNLIPPSETHIKAAVQPPLVSPIQSLAASKFNYPPSIPKPQLTPKVPPQLPPKEEPYPYVPPPPLPPPPGPPFQQTMFRDSPKEPYGPNTGGYRPGSQYYTSSEPAPSQYYNTQEDNKQYYPPGGAGPYIPAHPSRPYTDPYGSVPPPQAAAPPPPVHPQSAHPPIPPGHIPPVHPPIVQGHAPPGHGIPAHTAHVPPIRGLPVPPLGPYDDKPRPYLPGTAFPSGPRQPQNPPEGQYHFGHEQSAAHATATGIPTVRITGRY